jgi:hypothetical protein
MRTRPAQTSSRRSLAVLRKVVKTREVLNEGEVCNRWWSGSPTSLSANFLIAMHA